MRDNDKPDSGAFEGLIKDLRGLAGRACDNYRLYPELLCPLTGKARRIGSVSCPGRIEKVALSLNISHKYLLISRNGKTLSDSCRYLREIILLNS
jgi:hypothetical protein